MGAELSDWLFGQNKKKKLFFGIFYICVCLFCGECGCISMISICVADNSYKANCFLFITQIILIVILCDQINHLYDV